MKKNSFLFLCLTILASLFLSCQKEPASNEIINLQEKLDQFNAGKLPMNKGELLRGQAALIRKSDYEIGVAVQDENGKTYVYTLETDQKITAPNFKYFEEVQVLFLRHSVLINSVKSPERILLSNRKETILELADLNFTNNLTGFGLSRTTTVKIPDIKDLERQEIIYLVGTYTCTCRCRTYSNPDNDCQAGGKNSTSCSIEKSGSSCSTDCANEKYACCKCTKDDNPE